MEVTFYYEVGFFLVIGIIIQIITLITSRKKNNSPISLDGFVTATALFVIGAIITFSFMLPGAKHPAEQMIYLTAFGSGIMFILTSVFGPRNIRSKYVLLTLIAIDIVFILFIVFPMAIDQVDKRNRGYEALTREQAIAIAEQDINPGVKHTVTEAIQRDDVTNENFMWQIRFALYDKRDYIIGGYVAFVDEKQKNIVYWDHYKTLCKLSLNQSPIINGEVILVDNAGNGYLTGSATDYGFTNNEGKVNIALSNYSDSAVFVIDQTGVMRGKVVKYNENLQENCEIDYSNVKTQNPQDILQMLDR